MRRNPRLTRRSDNRRMSTTSLTDPVPSAPAAALGFLPMLELQRFLCAFGIVWYHMNAPHKVLFHVALPLFVVLAVFLSVVSLQRGGETRFWRARVRRILIPWLAWSAFYIAVEMARGEPSYLTQIAGNPLLILVGPTITLWFLPFLLLASLIVVATERWMRRDGDVERLLMLAVPVAAGSYWVYNHATLPEPLIPWSSVLPSVLYGLVVVYARDRGRPWAPLAFLGGLVLMTTALHSLDGVVALLFAALFFELGLRVRLPGTIWLIGGRLSFGIYLMHPFMMLVYYKLLPFGWPPTVGALTVFTASAAATFILTRLPIARALV